MQPSLCNHSFAAAGIFAAADTNFAAAEQHADFQCCQDKKKKTEGEVCSEVSWERV